MKVGYSLIVMTNLFFFFQSASAQTIEGRIKDLKEEKSIVNASVVLKTLNDVPVNGASTDINGTFRFKHRHQKGNYKLEVSSVGYQKKMISIIISKDTILNISLIDDVLELEEIVIVTEKTTTEQFLDKKVINVGKDLLSSGGNALTVLSQLPEIQSDINGNISLKGDKNVNVLVNGKPSPLSAAELLRQIPSGNVNKIEVITSPSAKYAANGLTGIINIITNKKVALGLAVNASATANSLGGNNTDVAVNIGQQKLLYTLGLGYDRNVFKNRSMENRENLHPFEGENAFEFKGNVYRAKAGLDWFPNKLNEFRFGLNYVDNGYKMLNEGLIFQGNKSIDQSNISSQRRKTFDFTTNYRYVFTKPENYLEFDLYLSSNKNLMNSEFQKNTAVPDNLTDNEVTISRVSVDYVRKLNDIMAIESGGLWEKQQLDNTFLTFDKIGSLQKENQFQNIQSTFASYFLLKFNINKLSIQAGLRGEVFRRNANLITDNYNLKSDFNNLFPSLHMRYNVFEGKTLSLGFNRRTSRPTLNQINPNTSQNTLFEINVGSPDLKPEFSNNFELGFQVKKSAVSIITGLSYRLKENIILNRISLSENGANIYKPINGNKSSTFGLDFSFTLKANKWWDANLFTNWNYETSRQTEVFFFRNFGINYGIALRNDIRLSDKTQFGLTWQYDGAQKSFISNTSKNQYFDIAIKRKMMKDNGNLSLRFSDIFNTQVYGGKDYGVNFIQNYRYKPVSRAIYLSLTYNLKKGSKLSERKIKSKEDKNG